MENTMAHQVFQDEDLKIEKGNCGIKPKQKPCRINVDLLTKIDMKTTFASKSKG
jgi:hypothetical protein